MNDKTTQPSAAPTIPTPSTGHDDKSKTATMTPPAHEAGNERATNPSAAPHVAPAPAPKV